MLNHSPSRKLYIGYVWRSFHYQRRSLLGSIGVQLRSPAVVNAVMDRCLSSVDCVWISCDFSLWWWHDKSVLLINLFRSNYIFYGITKPLSIKTIWNRELSDLNLSVDWERVWSNLSLTSKNLAHHLIHFKVIHRAYITPYKRFKMKLQSNLNCHILYVTLHHQALFCICFGNVLSSSVYGHI